MYYVRGCPRPRATPRACALAPRSLLALSHRDETMNGRMCKGRVGVCVRVSAPPLLTWDGTPLAILRSWTILVRIGSGLRRVLRPRPHCRRAQPVRPRRQAHTPFGIRVRSAIGKSTRTCACTCIACRGGLHTCLLEHMPVSYTLRIPSWQGQRERATPLLPSRQARRAAH